MLCLSQLAMITVEEGDWDRGVDLIARAVCQIERHDLSSYPTSALTFAVSADVRSRVGRVDEGKSATRPPVVSPRGTPQLARAALRSPGAAFRPRASRDGWGASVFFPPSGLFIPWYEAETPHRCSPARGAWVCLWGSGGAPRGGV